MLLKYRKSSNPSVFSQKFPAFEAIIYRTGFLDIRYLLGLSIYLLIILAVDILTDLMLYFRAFFWMKAPTSGFTFMTLFKVLE